MPIIHSAIRVSDPDFTRNAGAYRGLIDRLHLRRDEHAASNGKAKARHEGKGKLLPRDRIDVLLDPGSPFLEIGGLAAADMYDGVPIASPLLVAESEGSPSRAFASPKSATRATSWPSTVSRRTLAGLRSL